MVKKKPKKSSKTKKKWNGKNRENKKNKKMKKNCENTIQEMSFQQLVFGKLFRKCSFEEKLL